MFTLEELRRAHRVVGAAVPGTPQYVWPQLGARVGAEVWVKHENHVPTGAFKVRGGLTYVERLARRRGYRARPEITFSHRWGSTAGRVLGGLGLWPPGCAERGGSR